MWKTLSTPVIGLRIVQLSQTKKQRLKSQLQKVVYYRPAESDVGSIHGAARKRCHHTNLYDEMHVISNTFAKFAHS